MTKIIGFILISYVKKMQGKGFEHQLTSIIKIDR